jgi:alkylhydroperoxidase/carboxymuconolactone decarboxylase family protein YurZ
VLLSLISSLLQTINALLELKKVTPEELLDVPEPVSVPDSENACSSPTGRRADLYETPTSQVLQRGQAFFDMLYGKVARRVMSQMDGCGTEDLGLLARLAYGYILSSTAVLSPAETSFVMIAGLVPQDVNPQLKGHLRGALNGGATVDQVRAVRGVVVDLCRAAGMRLLDPNEPAGFGWRSEVVDL